MSAWLRMLLRPTQSSKAMATAPMVSMSGELMACARTERRLASNSRRAACLNRIISQSSILKALTMRFPVMVSCRMFWISASLSWPLRVVCRTWRPILRAETRTTGTKSSSTHASLPPRATTTQAVKIRVKNCCRSSASTEDMANCTRSISLISVETMVPVACCWKKETERRRMASYKVIAQVGDHAEPGIVHQVGSAVIADPLQQSGSHQREGYDIPRVVEMRGNNLLQTYAKAGTEERDGAVGCIGIEHAVENGTDQQEAEGIQKAHAGHQDDRGNRLQPIRPHIAQQAQQLPHAETPEARRCMECIPPL